MVIILAFLVILVDFSRRTDPGQTVQRVSVGCNSVMYSVGAFGVTRSSGRSAGRFLLLNIFTPQVASSLQPMVDRQCLDAVEVHLSSQSLF